MIEQRRRQYSILVYVFLSLAASIVFALWKYIWLMNTAGGGKLAPLALCLYSLSQAFRYDFWVYQFTKRKLGCCSLKEWWSS